MSDMFKSGEKFPMSAEFAELVNEATEGHIRPIVDETATIVDVKTMKSGQTLFSVEFKAMVGGMYDDEPDEGEKYTKKFPATVAQVQKMLKLQKKADKAAGIVKPVAVNPNKKVDVIPATPADDGDYDPFAASQDDF